MAFFPEPDAYQHPYGYLLDPDASVNLDTLKGTWASFHFQRWQRRLELFVRVPAVHSCCSEKSCVCIDEEFIEDFHRLCRDAFRYMAERHILTPLKMWQKVQQGLLAVAMHEDDVEFCEKFIFGWADIDQEQMERFRWRYPDRCPLLDVLCTLDDTHEELNKFQDKMLELKGSKGRRRLDVIPALPSPDGVRQPKREGVAGFLKFSDLIREDLF